MTDYEWMTALCIVCGEIDAIIKNLEVPVIDLALKNRRVKRMEPKLKVLAKPAWREIEVLVGPPDGNWYAQSRVAKGSMTSDCWFGNSRTKAGAKFKIVALTRDSGGLSRGSKHPNLPRNRTRSEEVTVVRG
jgi:hypothetical protein